MAIDRTAFNALIDDDGTGTKGTVWNKTQIQNVILNPVDTAISSNGWFAYTPSWVSMGSVNPVIGNGTLAGRFTTIGKTVLFQLLLGAGSTTTFGDNVWVFALPLLGNPIVSGRYCYGFPIMCYNASGAATLPSLAIPYSQQWVYGVAGAGGLISASAPFTWASGCSLIMWGAYEST